MWNQAIYNSEIILYLEQRYSIAAQLDSSGRDYQSVKKVIVEHKKLTWAQVSEDCIDMISVLL